ncbi:MAG: CehA/McbA family metallohydrolase [bacterium]|nr:CehA/McbA family metallohydrolase [bacterium]
MKSSLITFLCILLMITIVVAQEVILGQPIPFGTKINAEYPAIAIDSKDTIWLAWSEFTGNSDMVYLSTSDGKTVGEPILVGFGYQPLIVCDKKDGLWLVWQSKRDAYWQIYARYYDGAKLNNEIAITNGKSDAMHPSIALDNSDNLCIAYMGNETLPDEASAKSGGKHQIYFTKLVNGKFTSVQNITNNTLDNFRPSLAIDYHGTIWIAYDSYLGNGNYDIFLVAGKNGVWNKPIQVTTHPGIDAYPSLALHGNSTPWIAWHSNRSINSKSKILANEDLAKLDKNPRISDFDIRDSDLPPGIDIPKWVYVRGYDSKTKQCIEPIGEMPGKDLNKVNEDQGFEFPTLFFENTHRFWIFGRPSHDWIAQYYNGNQWSDPIRLSNGSWGGRGQFIRVAKDSQQNLWMVYRDIAGNFLRKIAINPKPEADGGLVTTPFQVENKLQSIIRYQKPAISHDTIGIYTVYYGDIHSHSWLSDGVGSIEESFTRARDVYQLDFYALTDHEEFVQNRISAAEWEEYKHWTKYYNQPGEFVTIPAYEWTQARVPLGDGHINVYFPNENYTIYPKREPATKTASGLFSTLEPIKALGFAHHIGWTGINWLAHNPNVQTCIEIISNHGAFEYMGNEPIKHRGGISGCFIQNGLAKGLKFGIIGGSDGHGLLWQHGVGYKRDPWRAGWTGVLAKSLTREEILDAFRNRRTFATTGEKILVDFRADGHYLGEEYSTTTAPEFSVYVKGTNLLHYVYLIRNNEVIYTNGGDSDEARFKFIDTEIPQGTNWYYLRVIQRDGNMAWSSPIWITYQ